MSTWLVYIVRAADDSLYVGVTNDLERRIEQHRSGRGAKYLRGRAPLTVVYTEDSHDRGSALKREAELKKLRRSQKESLIAAAVERQTIEQQAVEPG